MILVTVLCAISVAESSCADYLQVPGLIDLRSTFSDGAYDIETLVRLAKDRGFGIVVMNDHDRMAMEYGIPPFKNLVKRKVERPSINKNGAKDYLDSITRVRNRYPDMVILPGSETAAFYYWTGSYFNKTLTAHDHEKRMLTIGMENPEDYEHLPILHNGHSPEYVTMALPCIVLSLCFLVASIFLIRRKGFYRRIIGFSLCILSILFILNSKPFRSSPFDQYHGDQGIAPYQLLIDYVNSRGGLIFWNYPETKSGIRRLGPIRVHTPPHPEMLEESHDYTGFAALYGDNITVTEPGNVWDKILTEYCKGERGRPVWGISTADFHKEGESGEKLGNFPTVFLLREQSGKGVMEALRTGKMYACRGKYPQLIKLDEFSVCSSDGTIEGISGDEITLKDRPGIRISLSVSEIASDRKSAVSAGDMRNEVTVRLIRSGKLIETFKSMLPLQIDYKDSYYQPGKKIFYRMDMRGCGILVSNPIFVTFEK